MLFIFSLYFSVTFFSNCVNGTSLWNSVVKKEHVILTVDYRGRYLNVWRQDSHGYSRFYVTPLCVMETDSISCSRDEYSTVHRHVFEFNVKLWDLKAAETVKNGLKQKNISAEISDILPLPMQMVRTGLGGRDLIPEVDNQWRSNQDQPHVMSFELYVRHEHFCNKMVNDAKNDTKRFLRHLKPFFEFSMVVGQHVSRNLNITGATLQKSSFFSELMNKHADSNGIVYLQSKDLNQLVRDLFNKVAYDEEISTDYISSHQEQQIMNELLGIFKEQQIQSKDLTKDGWNSVFWDDIFARPDIQTEYANEVLQYNESEKHFKRDEEKDKKFRKEIENKQISNNKNVKSGKAKFEWFGLFKAKASGGYSNDNFENNENKEKTDADEKNTMKLEDLQKAITKENLNLRWTGMRFEPKDLSLYRLNTKNLNLSNEVYFKRVVVSKHETTQKIEIKAETVILGNSKNESLLVCPPGWTYYSSTNFCYKIIVKKLTWFDAELSCVKEESHLISIHSYREFLFATELANSYSTNRCSWDNQTWIGLSTNDNNDHWQWTDGTAFNFTTWYPGEPDSPGKENCGLMVTGTPCTGQAPVVFYNYMCNTHLDNFICKKAPKEIEPVVPSKTCQPSWTYYIVNGTKGYCYKVFYDNATWTDAENRCKADGAHLASVHSMDENLFIAQLAHYKIDNSCSLGWQGWIGHFIEDENSHWKWTDKTPFDYVNWSYGNYSFGRQPQEQGHFCGIMWLTVCRWAYREYSFRIGNFDNAPCAGVYPRFVCKKLLN